jgi:predicted N-acetyltransferase YhbS
VGLPAGIGIRLYRESDYAAVGAFSCADPGKKWTREAETVIRKAVDDLQTSDVDALLVVAEEKSSARIVGVVAFGVDPNHKKTRTIFSLGVVQDRRREGIGIALKRAALAELGAGGYGGIVYSQVHKYNTPMRELNRQLLAESEQDPDDGKMLLTAVKPSVTD